MVVGAIVEHPLLPNEVLLCRRNIEPQKGFWTLPAGYAELAETTAGERKIGFVTFSRLRSVRLVRRGLTLSGRRRSRHVHRILM